MFRVHPLFRPVSQAQTKFGWGCWDKHFCSSPCSQRCDACQKEGLRNIESCLKCSRFQQAIPLGTNWFFQNNLLCYLPVITSIWTRTSGPLRVFSFSANIFQTNGRAKPQNQYQSPVPELSNLSEWRLRTSSVVSIEVGHQGTTPNVSPKPQGRTKTKHQNIQPGETQKKKTLFLEKTSWMNTARLFKEKRLRKLSKFFSTFFNNACAEATLQAGYAAAQGFA